MKNDVILGDGRLSAKRRHIQGKVFAASRALDLLQRGGRELTKTEKKDAKSLNYAWQASRSRRRKRA